jgi:hypothetical protein
MQPDSNLEIPDAGHLQRQFKTKRGFMVPANPG